MLEAILGSVAPKLIGGIVGKIFGRKSKPQTNSVDYEALVRNAEKAGFNPLTALRNGGAAGHMITDPALSSSSFIADALSQGVNAAFGYKQDQRDEEREKIQLELMRGELREQQAREDAFKNYGFTPPSVTTYTGRHDAISQNGASGVRPALVGRLVPNVTDTRVAGADVLANPEWSDAEEIETRYGDALSWGYGVGVAGADFQHNNPTIVRNVLEKTGLSERTAGNIAPPKILPEKMSRKERDFYSQAPRIIDPYYMPPIWPTTPKGNPYRSSTLTRAQ